MLPPLPTNVTSNDANAWGCLALTFAGNAAALIFSVEVETRVENLVHDILARMGLLRWFIIVTLPFETTL